MAKAGFVAGLIPIRFGGTELSALDFAIAAEELTAVDINVPTTVLGTGLGLEPPLHFGSEETKELNSCRISSTTQRIVWPPSPLPKA